MDLRDTPEEAAFRAEVRAWVEANLPGDLQGRRRGEAGLEELGRNWSRKLSDAGYAGLTWPTAYGGAGAPYTHQAICFEELASGEAPWSSVISSKSSERRRSICRVRSQHMHPTRRRGPHIVEPDLHPDEGTRVRMAAYADFGRLLPVYCPRFASLSHDKIQSARGPTRHREAQKL